MGRCRRWGCGETQLREIAMAFTSYSDLKTTIANYLARSDLTTQIPDFIALAEARLSRELRTRKMLVVARADTVAGTETLGSMWLTRVVNMAVNLCQCL
jgi:hypothetical protein